MYAAGEEAAAPDKSTPLQIAGTGIVILLAIYIAFNFAVMFADWITGGGRPWQ